MSAPAVGPLRRQGAPDLLIAYAERSHSYRRAGRQAAAAQRGAACFLAVHPGLADWMSSLLLPGSPTSRAPVRGRSSPGVSSRATCDGSGSAARQASRRPLRGMDVAAPRRCRPRRRCGRAVRLERQLDQGRVPRRAQPALLTAGKTLDELTDDDFDGFAATSPMRPVPVRKPGRTTPARAVQPAPGLLRAAGLPAAARQGQAGRPPSSSACRPSPSHIRKVALRYLTTVASTLRPSTIELRADSLITFAEYLADHHPAVRSLTELTRHTWRASSPTTMAGPGAAGSARDQPVSAVQ